MEDHKHCHRCGKVMPVNEESGICGSCTEEYEAAKLLGASQRGEKLNG